MIDAEHLYFNMKGSGFLSGLPGQNREWEARKKERDRNHRRADGGVPYRGGATPHSLC